MHRHSDSYHRFFRGFTEVRIKNKKGRVKIERYYTQPWIVNTASGKNYWLSRLAYIMLILFSASVYISSMCTDVGSNCWWFAAIFTVVSILAVLILGVMTIRYCFTPKKMTLWQHESSTKRVKLFSLVTAGSMTVSAVIKPIYSLLEGGELRQELQSAGGVLMAAVAVLAIYYMERKMVYSSIPNDTVLPEGEAYEIW